MKNFVWVLLVSLIIFNACDKDDDIKIVDPTLPNISNINASSFSRGETMIITGKNLKKNGFATNINFMPVNSGVTLVRSGVANQEGTELTYTVSDNFEIGNYNIVVEVDFKFSEKYKESIEIKL